MTDWYSILFSGAGTAATTWAISYFWARARFQRIRFMDRTQVDQELGEVERRFDKAEQEVRISGNDCAFVAQAESPKIEKLLSRRVRVRLLMVDPNSSVPEMLSKIDPRFPTPEAFVNSMKSVLNVLRDIKARYPNHFDYRLLPILPAQGFFIVDPTSESGFLKVEIYTAKDWRPIDSRPHLYIQKKEKRWRSYFIHQWDNYWSIANEDAQQARR